ncbi:MAG: hypothetical protein LBH85_06430 [Treponema sp.]|nr:hypothetical protein [Treponema sp.]
MERDGAIAKAQRRLEEVTRGEGFRRAYISRQKALSDWMTGVNTAFEKGVEKGRSEDRDESRDDIARHALGHRGLRLT